MTELALEWRGTRENADVTDLPRKAVTRTAKLAALPLGIAGRATLGLGKRIGGRPAELVAAEIQQRTADQVFKVLGELKGGAMKFGQAMSIFEAALPEELVAPYRASLTKLQDAAPPMPAKVVHGVLREELGSHWRRKFREFDDVPAAAASIGQVHRAVWRDGRDVAVKLQYPGAAEALRSDLNQVSRLGRVIGSVVPGLDVRPLLDELKDRVIEELDYRMEADAQDGFAFAYVDDPDFVVPSLVHGTERVLVSDWVDGRPLSDIILAGSKQERDHAGLLYVRFLFSGPERAGLLHADPHPGNYRITPDGRLGVLDYGAVARLPEGLPPLDRRADEAGAGRQGGRDAGRASGRGVRQTAYPARARRGLRLPGTVPGAGRGRDIPLRPSVDAGTVLSHQRPAPAGIHGWAQAQPAPVVPTHPPGLDRRAGRSFSTRL